MAKINRYFWGITWRVAIMAVACFGFVWFYLNTIRPATTLFFFLWFLGSFFFLIYYLNRINRDLSNFLMYLQDNNTSIGFSTRVIDKEFQGLAVNLNEIIWKIQQEKLEKEEKHHFLNAVLENIGTGLISFTTTGEIEFINPAALRILGIGMIKHLEELNQPLDNFGTTLMDFPANAQKMMTIKTGQYHLHLSIKSSTLQFKQRKIKLIGFQDIRYELESKELDSWRKLIRLLRHEIMNSMTPITTLTTAIRRNFEQNHTPVPTNLVTSEKVTDVLECASLIEERSIGLIGFVEKFRDLTNLPQPVIQHFSAKALFDSMKGLFANYLLHGQVNLNSVIDENGANINGDEKLIEQVLINLIKNSIEALPDNRGNIILKAGINKNGFQFIQVIDDGCGISPEDQDKLFIPSFTTKKSGTGIGLSISRQIMQLHQGELNYKPMITGETCFELIFPS